MSNSNDQLDDSILNIMVEQGVIHPDMLVQFVLEEVVSTALVVRAAIAALVGTNAAVSPAVRSPTDPSIVRTGDAPTCKVVGGHTVVNYSPAFHTSF
ncbi:MAG: hypothetical protein HOE14_08385, partial [Gemmatimonadales bacterium]|nr:hypothetical protein [Gemmatimonadales bacterium]